MARPRPLPPHACGLLSVLSWGQGLANKIRDAVGVGFQTHKDHFLSYVHPCNIKHIYTKKRY